ncbi:8-amino-7-oxononanoate synthase [Gynuella sunshinyii]|uniref:7-keto-8-aminopelargonate synthetase-related enzyme n=1 Tax=Gynuella sunshinyii YC6258 TaxID=1445510 RepID=A0A0C5VVJ3_9GAMM|nr:8-amino-7-oxononanoate synthase [Gynuella sunshinyii]AJQ97308.1 7-keto-8-aminopelargonate synthetase-related enzyme [Gynuella sunshinyii YC6258]
MHPRFDITLNKLREQHSYRECSLPSGLDLSSNDYLGLHDHPVLIRAAHEALEMGVAFGSGGSRLLRGNTAEHEALEQYAAYYHGCEKTLFFANGFMANHALLTSLPNRHDVILYDARVHASSRDGIQASVAKSVRIAHNDLADFADRLQQFRASADIIWIVVESLYSMDGDMAPLQQLYELAQVYQAILIVDEAHASGIWGVNGKGLCEQLCRPETDGAIRMPENLITLHTCGKALGVAGGIVCATATIIDTLINTCRPFIFSTAPPPIQAYMTLKSMELCASEEGARLRQQLKSICVTAQQLFGGHGTQIIPIILGDNQQAIEASTFMQQAGYDIRAIRPPTVPPGTSRLRLSLNVHITPSTLEDIRQLLSQLDTPATFVERSL